MCGLILDLFFFNCFFHQISHVIWTHFFVLFVNQDSLVYYILSLMFFITFSPYLLPSLYFFEIGFHQPIHIHTQCFCSYIVKYIIIFVLTFTQYLHWVSSAFVFCIYCLLLVNALAQFQWFVFLISILSAASSCFISVLA